MTTANELLRHALDALNWLEHPLLTKDIRAYLATADDAGTNQTVLVNDEEVDKSEEVVNLALVAALRLSIAGYVDNAYVDGDELLTKVLADIRNHPPKAAEWQWLKTHEIVSLWSEAISPAYFARAIEQVLKEKNANPPTRGEA